MTGQSPANRPLFQRFPVLRGRLPFVELAALPTPVRPLAALGRHIGASSLHVKDDAATHGVYGGNKVRKLEFLLAAALAERAKSVLTFGYAGSNHATATAVHAESLGLGSISMLLPQENAAYLRTNLLVSAAVGAELHEYPSRATLFAGTALTMLRHRLRSGRAPYVIAPGGSSPLGTVGFVNAAFELGAQVEAGLLPLPSLIYAAGGSLGTVVGLSIGLAVMGLPTRVVGVRVVEENFVNTSRAAGLWRKTCALLHHEDAAFPEVPFDPDRLLLRGEFFGGVYARVTEAAAEASGLASKLEGLRLDGTYTAKALACLVADARSGELDSRRVLFWNTRNGADLTALAAKATPSQLPPRLRRYFAETGDAGQ